MSHSTTIPRDTVKGNQRDDEQSGVKQDHKAATNKNSQTVDEHSQVRNDNETVENINNQTNDEQYGFTNGHQAGANKPALQFTVIEQQGDLVDFQHSIAHCISAIFKLRAGLVKQIKETFPGYFPTTKSTNNKHCTHSTWVMINLFFTW